MVQAVDAPVALVSGHLFDKFGIKILVLTFALAVVPVFFVSYSGLFGIVVACVMFGFVLGMQDSIYPAAVCELVPLGRRGTAYGVFYVVLGFGTFVSGVVFGYFLEKDFSMAVLVVFTLLLQIGAILALSHSRKTIF